MSFEIEAVGHIDNIKSQLRQGGILAFLASMESNGKPSLVNVYFK